MGQQHESVIEAVEHHQGANGAAYDDADLEEIPIRVARRRVVDPDAPAECPECDRALHAHSPAQAFKCMKAAQQREDIVADHDAENPYARPGRWYVMHAKRGHEEEFAHHLEALADTTGHADRIHELVPNKKFPGYLMVRCELDDSVWQMIRHSPGYVGHAGTGSRPSPLSRNDVEKFLDTEETEDDEEVIGAKSARNFEMFDRPKRKPATPEVPAAPIDIAALATPPAPAVDGPAIDTTVPADPTYQELKAVPMPVNEYGEVEVDFEGLAAAMRTVLDKERDEMIKRGGPIEKQNIELKERLASALDAAKMWRERAQAAGRRANLAEEQRDVGYKEIRRLKNELAGRKEKDHVRLVELEDILEVVDKSPGWSRERGGNGHWQVKLDGVFVTDLAGSGGSTRVNMASRTKLRKKGLRV